MVRVKVSVIIVSHRFDNLFKQAVESVFNKGDSFVKEVIVVGNGMGVDRVDRVEEANKMGQWLRRKPVKFLQMQEGNPSKARNLGAMVARGKYLLFLDNDTKLIGGLDKVVKYLDKHPRVGGGQLKLLRMQSNIKVTNLYMKFDSTGEMLTRTGFLVERAREAKDKGQFDKAELIFSGKGAGMVVRKSVFEKVGGFDEDYIYYWEEPDLFWRVWKAGFEVRFLWMGVVEHAYGTNLKPLLFKKTDSDQVYLACRNQILTVLKNGTGWQKLQMLTGVSLGWLGLEILFLVRGRFKHSWAVERAWWWILRRRIKRSAGLGQIDNKVLVKREVSWYLGKALAYIKGRGF